MSRLQNVRVAGCVFALLTCACNPPAFLNGVLHRSAGILFLELGWTLEQLQRRSTLTLPKDNVKHAGDILAVGQSPFDLQLGERGPLLQGCRYYWLSTKDSQPPLRLSGANIGISPEKMRKPELDRYVGMLGTMLEAGGWSRGHYDYSLADHPEWHRGASDSNGCLWARGDTFMRFLMRRMDDAKRDEPPDSGEFIVYAEIGLRAERASKEMVFSAPR